MILCSFLEVMFAFKPSLYLYLVRRLISFASNVLDKKFFVLKYLIAARSHSQFRSLIGFCFCQLEEEVIAIIVSRHLKDTGSAFCAFKVN